MVCELLSVIAGNGKDEGQPVLQQAYGRVLDRFGLLVLYLPHLQDSGRPVVYGKQRPFVADPDYQVYLQVAEALLLFHDLGPLVDIDPAGYMPSSGLGGAPFFLFLSHCP